MHIKKTVTVIGAGLMGHGIAQVFARAGHAVVITDQKEVTLGLAIDHIRQNLIDEGVDPEPTISNISTISNLQIAVSQADMVIEAVPEQLELKQRLFAEVAQSAPKHAILASNTSVIPITQIGEYLPPDVRSRLLGTHWWNPAPLIPLVEVVRTIYTDNGVFERTFEWLRSVGKVPIKVHRDITGFIGNRLQHALWREAIGLIEDGVCDAESIDLVVKNSFGMRLSVLGPMENADLVGLELTRDVQRVMFPDLRCDKSPSEMLDRLIAMGQTGMNAGQGLRSWDAEQATEARRALAMHLINIKTS